MQKRSKLDLKKMPDFIMHGMDDVKKSISRARKKKRDDVKRREEREKLKSNRYENTDQKHGK